MTDTLLALSTERCRIAPLHADDAIALAAITDESVTSRVDFLPTPFTESDARALIAGSGRGDVFHAVRGRDDGALYGVVGVHRRDAREVEVGYWFAAAARGRGVATEAVDAVVRELTSAGMKVIAECHPDNQRSRALLRRLGFQPTGQAGRRAGRMLFLWRAGPGIDVC